ncbi:MAG: prepilin-type N-terminal cleavage/methylation domain-containing protein [Bacteroidota bacterium]
MQNQQNQIRNTPLRTKLKAFTLTELMVVLVIIGILMLIALPNVLPLIAKAHSLEAQKQLQFLASLQESHYQVNLKYAAEPGEIGFIAPKTIPEGGDAKYDYQVISAGQNNFLARATAVVDFDNDGIINVWEIDQDGKLRQVTPD